MLDILNNDGTPTGHTASKKEAHEKGLWHKASHIWFVNDKNEILLQKRSDTMISHPGEYDISAAGHLSAGDTSISGALREIKEELGLDLEEMDLVKIGETKVENVQRNGTYINKEYNDVYVVHKNIPISDMMIQESEVSLVKYVPIDDLKKWVDEGTNDIVRHPEEFKMLFEYLNK